MVSGRYPWALGNHLMRCNRLNPPRCFTHELVDAGYHVSWPTKLDFNFEPTEGWCTDQDSWWTKDAPSSPFFLYRNFNSTHESRMFPELPGWHEQLPPLPAELKHTPEEVPIPPYLPDTPELRTQLVAYYDALSAIDSQTGECLDWLEEQGRAENTVVIFLSDHGRGLPREKRWCYDAGIHLPLIIRWPKVLAEGSISEDLISWVDIAPTILSLAGIASPAGYDGQTFLGSARESEREYIFAGRDRMDGVLDKVRVCRDKRWHYIRNDIPQLPYAQKQDYMEQQPIMPVMRALHAEGKLTGPEASFFAKTKPPEELYDTENDPDMLNNLAADPSHHETLERLRNRLADELARTGDLGETTEEELIAQGVVDDQMTFYRKRNYDLLPEGQQLGPYPGPTTLRDLKLD